MRKQAWIAAIFLVMGLSWSCQDDVSVVYFDKPPIEPATRELIITTESIDGLPLAFYDLTIEGPKRVTVRPGTEVYTLEDIVSGTYTITVVRGGYVGATREVEITVPADETIEYRYRVRIELTKKNEPVVVDNAAGGTIVVPSANTGGSGIGSSPITVTVPAGALPGTGSTGISITPVPWPADVPAASVPDVGVGTFTLVCEPAGLVFAQPISVQIPLDIPAAAAQGVTYRLVYKTGNPAEGNLTFSTNPADNLPVSISADGKSGTVAIPHFSAWQVVGGLEVETTETFTAFTNIDESAKCGEGLTGSHVLTGNYGALYASTFNLSAEAQKITLMEPYDFPAIEGYSRKISARHKVITYEIRDINTNALLEKFTVPAFPIELQSELVVCHDSGG